MADPPYVLLFPYLPVASSVDVGPWTLLPLIDFKGPWVSDAFRESALAIAERHVDRAGVPLTRLSILVDRETGAGGAEPTLHQIAALQLALGFGVLDAAPWIRSDAEIKAIADAEANGDVDKLEAVRTRLSVENDSARGSSVFGTSDNAEPYFWPVHADGRIAQDFGYIAKVTVALGGPSSVAKVLPPAEVYLPPVPFHLHEARLGALYSTLERAPLDSEAQRMRDGVRWLLQAWRNTPSLDEAHRVVLLRTAFEVMLREEGDKRSPSKEVLARRLSGRFESLPSDAQRWVNPGVLLWQPTEPVVLLIPSVKQTLSPFTDLERWFIAFSDVRNRIVHEGVSEVPEDSEEGSCYSGPFWRVASRVLRDLVLVDLHIAGLPWLWQDRWGTVGRQASDRLEGDGGDTVRSTHLREG